MRIRVSSHAPQGEIVPFVAPIALRQNRCARSRLVNAAGPAC